MSEHNFIVGYPKKSIGRRTSKQVAGLDPEVTAGLCRDGLRI